MVSSSRTGDEITKRLINRETRISQTSGRKIGDIITTNGRQEKNQKSVIYEIPCTQCESKYFGETSRGIKKRTYEHKQDVRFHKTSNSLVVHIDETGHLPNWDEIKTRYLGLDKKMRKLTEAALISSNNKTTNHREGFFTLSTATARKVLTTRTEAVQNSSIPGRPPERSSHGD